MERTLATSEEKTNGSVVHILIKLLICMLVQTRREGGLATAKEDGLGYREKGAGVLFTHREGEVAVVLPSIASRAFF